MSEKITMRHLHLIHHAISHPGRNYFAAERKSKDCEDWLLLVREGMAIIGRNNISEDVIFHVTEKGRKFLNKEPDNE